MSKIRQLDDTIANKIAAGEVVERPASVVKELVENSIDASSTSIHIDIKQGGMESIVVSDNGFGMSGEDAVLCFSRHATSKIIDDHDLFNISTLGFRGEAIPSVASISEFILETCDDQDHTRITYQFGKRQSIESVGMSRGTRITVKKLFQNVPARLKYVKSVNAEFAAIYTYIERIALAYPTISFTLTHDDKLIFSTNGNGNLLEVISNIYGLSVAKNMIHVDFENEEFHIFGYISKIEVSRASKNHIITLVNHRYVKNMMTINAINDVYKQYLLSNRYPICVLNIDVDPYLVDVNVHPSKLEVRFSKETALKDLLIEGLNASLKGIDQTYQVVSTPKEIKKEVSYEQPSFELKHETVIQSFNEPVFNQSSTVKDERPNYQSEELLKNKEDIVINKEVKEVIKPLKEKIYAKGQVRGTYLLGENEKGMYLIDQHAAQERINYEFYKEKYSHLEMTMQPLLVPLIFEFTSSEFLMIEERKQLLEDVGIYLEVHGSSSYVVRNLPLWIKNIDSKIFIEEMIHHILSNNALDVVAMQEHAIATLSCKASLKANTYLTLNDIQTIMDNLMRCENPYVCPHGRPTILFYSDYELEKLFKRVV